MSPHKFDKIVSSNGAICPACDHLEVMPELEDAKELGNTLDTTHIVICPSCGVSFRVWYGVVYATCHIA